MNWWMLAGGLMALICAVGHGVSGRTMFYRPISSAITSDFYAGVFAGMWHLITINFALSALLCSSLHFPSSPPPRAGEG